LAKAKAAKNPQPPAAAPVSAPAKAETASAVSPPSPEPTPVAAEKKAEKLDFDKPITPPLKPLAPLPVSEPTVAAPVEVKPMEPSPPQTAAVPVSAEPPPTRPIHFEEETYSAIPIYSPDQPPPASALDGYVLDEEEVLNAITQVDTQSVEQESQVLEAVEVIHMPVLNQAGEDLLEDPPAHKSASMDSISIHSPSKSPAVPSVPPPSDPPAKSSVKHGFF
jgi:predicted Zn-ribbon and HTH transcriptional regulator